MRVAGIQFAPVWENREANYEQVRGFAQRAKQRGADWLVLPEMFATGFSMNLSVTAEAEDGPTRTFLKNLAKETGMGILAGLVLLGQSGKGRNVALAVGPDGREIGRYSKAHLIGLLGETDAHQPGDGPVVFDLDGIKAACFVCYDLRFPELFRMVADQVQVYFVLASWPDGRQHHWDLLLPARAVENLSFMVGVNRVGRGGGLTYQGGSAIYGPMGESLDSAGDKEGLVVADLDPARVLELRAELPFLTDRRF